MEIYHYGTINFEFLGSDEADPDPMNEGDFLIPAFATNVQPPAAGANQIAILDTVNLEWSLVADNRGAEYWLEDGSHGEINEIGLDFPVNALFVEPAVSVADVVAEKSQEISSATYDAVTAGFISDALGTDHFYGTLETDQLNLSALVALDADRIYPCRDESDQSWDRRAHTVAQLRTVMTTGTDYIQTILIQKDVFVAQLSSIAADSLLTDDEKRTQINALVIQY